MKISKIGSFENLWSIWIFCSGQFLTVLGQCQDGFELSCVWTHDPKSALRWTLKEAHRDRYVELSNCNHPDCGIGIIQSPWLRPRNREAIVALNYKIYGTSDVYLRMYLKTEDKAQHQLFAKEGNYAYGFPEDWSSQRVRIPGTPTRHRLVLKAFTPYKEAVVAVKDINLDGTFVLTSTFAATIIPEAEEMETTPLQNNENNEEIPRQSTDPPGEYDFDNEIDDEDDEDGEEQFQTLEMKYFVGEEDLKKGITTVVEPNICMYK